MRNKSAECVQDTILSCRANFHSLLHYVITIHQRYRLMDGQTDIMHIR